MQLTLVVHGAVRRFLCWSAAYRHVALAVLLATRTAAAAPDDKESPEQRDPPAAPVAHPEDRSDTLVRTRAEFSAYGDTDAVTVFTPSVAGSVENPISGWSAAGAYLVDVVSAASVDILSTASGRWEEIRHAASVGAAYKPGTAGASLSGSVSREPDYTSLSAGGSLSLDLSHKTVNPVVGYAYTHDTAGRTGTPFSVFSQVLERHTASASVELVLSGSSVLWLGADAMFERGDQTKPYRFVPLFSREQAALVPAGASVGFVRALQPEHSAEATPRSRGRLALSARFSKRFGGATLILGERLYTDDWGLLATTTDLRIAVDLSRRWLLWGHLRGHAQRGVSFWQRAYTGGPAAGVPVTYPQYRTGDRELSPLLAGTAGLGLQWELGAEPRKSDWILTAQGDFLTTHFSDALYIKQRQGYLGVLQLEATF